MIGDGRLRRIAGVTVGLMGAGAVCGALAGAAALIISLWLEHDPGSFDLGLLVGPIFGGPIGAITAPILAWLLLRRVAFGELFVRLSAGTTIGGVVGWMTVTGRPQIVSGLAGAFVGCVVAAIRMHYRASRLEACRSALLR